MKIMTVTRYEDNIILQTPSGRKFADEYQKRLLEQGAFNGRNESTVAITIKAIYHFDIVEDSI